MTIRPTLDARAIGIMLTLCLIWALQQIVLKAAAPDITPLMQIAVRSGVAAVLVGLLMAWRKEALLPADGTWRPGLVAGLLFGIEFVLLGEALRFTSASHAVVFLYTAPIFVALGLHWKLPAERLSLLQWFGIVLAFSGIAVTFLGRDQPATAALTRDILLGDVLALLAGFAWGATTVVVRITSLARTPATRTVFYQLVVGFVILILAAILGRQTTIHWTPIAWVSLVFQSVIVCFLSYLVWFWLLQNYLASRLGVFSFMTPLFGILLSVWLLGEPLETSFLFGAVLVLSGVVLVSGYGWLKQTLLRLKQHSRT